MTEQTKSTWTLPRLRRHRDSILALAEEHGAYNVRVFGSVARGTATENSDIDFIVSTHDDVNMFGLVGLWLDLQDLLGCDVSLITDDDNPRRERFMQQVHKESIPL